jgi:peptidyl-prolyl cis-trans isomerase A (cyclophilin A)
MKKIIVLLSILMLISIIFSGCVDVPEIPDEVTKKMTIVSFNVEPSVIELGDTANLSWVVTGSDTVVNIDNGIGDVSLTGNRIITPTETTTYILKATNSTSTKNATTQIIVNTDNEDENNYEDDPEYESALAGTTYPVAVFETIKGVIAVELYDDQAPETCKNFIKLVNDGFYDGMIFHRISNDFMIQAGNTMPDGTTKESPYGKISKFEGNLNHEDGTISMASTGAGVPGEAQFFICDGAQPGLDRSYAAFGKTIYGIEVVRDIADDPQDNSSPAGGGRPYNDIIIEKIFMVKT